MSCAKTAEPIEMQSGMLNRVGPRNMYYMGMQVPLREMALFEVSSWLKSIVRGWVKGRAVQKQVDRF